MLLDRAGIDKLLRSSRRIAVVGLSPDPSRPSHSVAAYLQRAGYTIIPVHPDVERVLGEQAFPDLQSAAAATGPIDIVNLFRRSEHVPQHVDDILAVRPRLVWMQSGIRHDDTARRLEEAGIPVVMNRCLAVVHRLLKA